MRKRKPPVRQCVSGAARGERCAAPAADGFDYCQACGLFLGTYLMQLPPGDSERERMKQEREADARAAKEQR